jgi:hypothetical protein
MSGTIPPFTQYAFMAWCSVKNTGETLLLPLPLELICGSLKQKIATKI